jgi:hypothetical protein
VATRATNPTENDPGVERIQVPLFESAHDGYGDAQIVTSPHRYNRITGSIDARRPGELRFGPDFEEISYGATFTRPPIWAAAARSKGATAAALRHPVLLFIVDSTLYQIQYGVVTSRTSLAQVATGACFHDQGTGTPRLMIAEGNNGNAELLNLVNSDTADTITGALLLDKVASIGGVAFGSALYALGGFVWNSIRLLPTGSDPAVAANWETGVLVGDPMTDINNIIGVRGVPCVLKPEGIFLYNRSYKLWENMIPAWESDAHPNNGRAVVSFGPNIIVSMGFGGAVIFDGYNIRDFSPYGSIATPNADTTSQIISAMGSYGGNVIAATAVSNSFVGGSGSKEEHLPAAFSTYNQKEVHVGTGDNGIRVWKTTDGESSFTGYSTEAGDGNFTTVVALGGLAAEVNDFFYIGYRYPWRAAVIEFDVGNSTSPFNTNSGTLTGHYWDGSAWTTLGVGATNHYDFTATASVGTLGRSGIIALRPQTAMPTDWTARTLSTDVNSHYYIRFTPTSAALSTTVDIASIRLIPLRPSADLTNLALDEADRSGVFPHLLMGRDGGEERPNIWHDLGSTLAVDQIGAIATAPVGGATGSSPYKIVLLGKRAAFFYHINNTPTWPTLDTRGYFESASIDPAGGRVVQLTDVFVFGRDFDAVSQLTFYYRYDQTQPWSMVNLGTRPPYHTVLHDAGKGTHFQWAVFTQISSAANGTAIRTPVITDIEGRFIVLDDDPISVSQRPIATPQRG